MAPISDNEDADDILDALEAEHDGEEVASYRANRIKQLNEEFSDKLSTRPIAAGTAVTTLLNNASYPTILNDQSLLDFTTQVHRCAIHFFHPDFARCEVMDSHFSRLSQAHGGQSETRFARVDAREVPFVVTKLKVKVLPCVLGFVDGAVVEKITGFEGLVGIGQLAMAAANRESGTAISGDGGFKTSVLEKRLAACGVLTGGLLLQEGDEEDESEEDSESETRYRKTIRSGRTAHRSNDDEDDLDWD